jgi:hypothetical protein
MAMMNTFSLAELVSLTSSLHTYFFLLKMRGAHFEQKEIKKGERRRRVHAAEKIGRRWQPLSNTLYREGDMW